MQSLYTAKSCDNARKSPKYSDGKLRKTWCAYSGSFLNRNTGPHGRIWSNCFPKNITTLQNCTTLRQGTESMFFVPSNEIPKLPLRFAKHFSYRHCNRLPDITSSCIVELKSFPCSMRYQSPAICHDSVAIPLCPKCVGSFGYSTDFPLRKTVRSDIDSIRKL